MHARAETDYDLLVSTDRHFRRADRFAPTPKLGIIYVRVVPNTPTLVVQALDNLLTKERPEDLVGRLTIARREDYEIR